MNTYDHFNEAEITSFDSDIQKTSKTSAIVTRYYRFGKQYFCFYIPENMNYPENLSKFEISRLELPNSEEASHIIEYTFEFSDDIPAVMNFLEQKQVPGRTVKRDNFYLFPTQTGECRFISVSFAPEPYAISWQKSEHSFHVWVSRNENRILICDPAFVALLSLEKHMIKDNAMILHCAYMLYNGKAVLFSAPSQTGKSTQASLWEKYRHTRTINGDRALLVPTDKGWYAYGWPVCGSSEICFNEAYPVHAIVMLKQAKENKAYPLKGISALKEIMSQITINSWNNAFQLCALDNIEKLISELPIYRLECDISEQAVECLEKLITF